MQEIQEYSNDDIQLIQEISFLDGDLYGSSTVNLFLNGGKF